MLRLCVLVSAIRQIVIKVIISRSFPSREGKEGLPNDRKTVATNILTLLMEILVPIAIKKISKCPTVYICKKTA